MASEDPNRLGPVTREWVAALERRIEELESAVSAILYAVRLLTKRGSSAEANVAAWNALEHVEVVNGGRCDEAPATVSHKGRKVSLQEAAEIAMRTLADAERGRDEAATIHLVRRSPESAAVYWREQWEKMHAEVISLRVESHEWKTKYESQCRGVKSYLEQIDSLRAQLAARPVVTATDEQVKALVHDICSGEWHPAVAQSIRSWLSTLGVVQTKQVEAWVAGDRLPLNGEVYALPTSAVLRCATFHHEEPSKARVLVRKTLNVVQEPNNANPV